MVNRTFRICVKKSQLIYKVNSKTYKKKGVSKKDKEVCSSGNVI